MKEIFRTLAGFLILLVLVQVIRSLILTHVPVFEFLNSALLGFVFIIGALGMIIIFKSAKKLFLSPLSIEK